MACRRSDRRRSDPLPFFQFSHQGTNQEVKELVTLIDLSGQLMKEKFDESDETEETSEDVTSSSSQRRSSETDAKVEIRMKLLKIRQKIRAQIPPTIKSVEADIYKSNLHNVILSMSNWLGGKIISKMFFWEKDIPIKECQIWNIN